MNIITTGALVLTTFFGVSQVPAEGSYYARAYAKEITETMLTTYLVEEILLTSEAPVLYSMDDVVAEKSEQLILVAFECESLDQSGVIFGFYGNLTTENCDKYEAYAFTHYDKVSALEFLDKIITAYYENDDEIEFDHNQKVTFIYDDLVVILTADEIPLAQINWGEFSAEISIRHIKKKLRQFKKRFK